MKNRFFGKYYKFISDDGYVFACIDSFANEGKMLQVITSDASYLIEDTAAFSASENGVDFNIQKGSLSIVGHLEFGALRPLKTKVMGPFAYLPLECKHEIYSVYHTLDGVLKINGKDVTFTDSPGYIEGDSGRNFPKKYIWYNSVAKDLSVTMAVATIPIGFIRFFGILCFVTVGDKEYKLCTYNFAKAAEISENRVVIKKGRLTFTLNIENGDGHKLKAPVSGNMERYIKESVTIKTNYSLSLNGDTIIEAEDPRSSLEYMWD